MTLEYMARLLTLEIARCVTVILWPYPQKASVRHVRTVLSKHVLHAAALTNGLATAMAFLLVAGTQVGKGLVHLVSTHVTSLMLPLLSGVSGNAYRLLQLYQNRVPLRHIPFLHAAREDKIKSHTKRVGCTGTI